MDWKKVPAVNRCCGCVTDLKSAAAIIAVLAIVTCPALSWAVVRHSYVIRVSCFVTATDARPDVIDISLNNDLSFGFGINAGLGTSCLAPKKTNSTFLRTEPADPRGTALLKVLQVIGSLVLLGDIVLIGSSIFFLMRIFKHKPRDISPFVFMWSCAVAIVLSFLYGIIFISLCMSIGGRFPLYELLFTVIDALLWVYFIIVVRSYVKFRQPGQNLQQGS